MGVYQALTFKIYCDGSENERRKAYMRNMRDGHRQKVIGDDSRTIYTYKLEPKIIHRNIYTWEGT
jgi:hypothetical protein